MIDATLRELSAALASKRVSSVELTTLFLERIARSQSAAQRVHHRRSRCLVDPGPRRRRAHRRRRSAALTGVPIAHKDIFVTRGWLTTCGSKMLADFVGPYDAHVIERFSSAGGVMLGKTNMDEFAMGSSNETSYFGPVKNPWNTAMVPGGSSGGSAAAVAARLTPAATGTDTGGSIRQPAALCGITGLKPTYGIVSRYGMIAFASSLDQGGPMAKSAEDCALLLNVMAGFDARDSTSLERAPEDYARDLDRPLAGLRIGLPREFFADGLASDVARTVEAAIAEFGKLGATTVDVSLPNMKLSIPVYYVLAPAEASSNLSRFDGVRYGYRAPEYDDLLDMYCKTPRAGLRRRSQAAHPDRHLRAVARLLRRLLPAGATTAPPDRAGFCRGVQAAAMSSWGRPARRSRSRSAPRPPTRCRCTSPTSTPLPPTWPACPAMSIPCGFGAEGLPVGLQIIGNYFDEARMLNVAHQYQLATDWHQRMPAAALAT